MTMWTIDDQHETMPWDELDAVVFDVGNVLVAFQPQLFFRGRPSCTKG